MTEEASASPDLQFKKILFAVEDADGANGALPTVIGLARLFGSEVLVVHLREHAALGREKETIPEAVGLGEQVSMRLGDSGISAEFDVHRTSPDNVGDDLLKAASGFQADLIVIGPYHAHGGRHRLTKDIEYTLAHRAACPVLLVPIASS
jgi:nucleotide-binding universal stress UspA family protein